MNIILASQSPRRKELLGYIVNNFTQSSADIDETVLDGEMPQNYVERLANEKAKTIFDALPNKENQAVIGSDTSVINEGVILGKPQDLDDCIQTLLSLSGKAHHVMTAFSIVTATKVITRTVFTEVEFTKISKQQVIDYWHTNEPQDKAGSYAIQGIGGKFVKSINGSVSAVVGLPLVELEEALRELQAL